MLRRRRILIAAIVSVLGLGLTCPACGSSSSGASAPAVGQSCDDYFDAIVGVACNATTPPADEIARIRTIFDNVCQNALALPGNGVTGVSLEACATAIKATGCGIAGIAGLEECAFQGSLPNGKACNDSSQCQSGHCKVAGMGLSDGGAPNACGTCDGAIAVGQPCTKAGSCVSGAACDTSGTGFACELVTYGDVGAKCDDLATSCKTGLYCNVQTSTCVATGNAGDPCSVIVGCTAPLVCIGQSCQTGRPGGAACQTDDECASGLGCSTKSGQCTTITWVSQGQPCTEIARCLVGNCPVAGGPTGPPGRMGNCPRVVPDGQPCVAGDGSQTCDTFSVCTNGVCQQPDSVVCR